MTAPSTTTDLQAVLRCCEALVAAFAAEDDLTSIRPDDDILAWHKVLLTLRDHYADPTTNPREQFTVGLARGADGTVGGIAISSVRQPLVDDRIAVQQQLVFEAVKDTGPAV